MSYFGYFLLAFIISFFLTLAVRKLMRHFNIVDEPKAEKRKIHQKKIPLGGGLGIFISFFAVAALVLLATDKFGPNVVPKYVFALFLGGLVLMFGGFLDDKYNLPAKRQILFPLLAALIVILFGIGPEAVTNPFGGVIKLDFFKINAGNLGTWLVISNLLVFFWLMAMMYTTKLMDGLDGLAVGVVAIGAFMIYFLSRQEKWYQPDLALLAIIFAGACVGFLLWNWHPAKIFLGEGGALFLGFMLGCLAVISGGKIATTLLVMGVPMMDVARVIIRRLRKKQPVYVGDSEHLHFRLLASGLTQKQAVLLLCSISFLFGITTLFLQSRQKLIALLFLFILMMLVGIWVSKKRNERNERVI